jgi:putative ABC transport system substrate-binding protein
VNRREFITLLGGAAAPSLFWPLAARAQQQPMPVIGYLGIGTQESDAFRALPFRQGLKDAGYIEGQNVAIEYRWPDEQYDRLPALAADLVRRQVAVIAAMGDPTVVAAKAATNTIPIVFSIGRDPVEVGFVTSLARPGGNLTGVTSLNAVLGSKRLELLHELIPAATSIVLLVDPTNPAAEVETTVMQAAARALGLQLHVVQTSTLADLDAAFATFVRLRAGALVISPDAFFISQRERLAELSVRHGVPTISGRREFTLAGGLMSYGGNITDAYRQVGIYTGRILKGEKAAELPVMYPTKYELVINLKTAKTLGVMIPQTLLVAADEVIE